jgi:MFS family permease
MIWYIVIISALAQFIAAYTSNVTVIALPEIAKVFSLNNILQNWVVNIYTLTIAILSVPFGKICSKYGLKKSFLIGEIIFFIGAVGTILSLNTQILFFFRVLQAIGATSIFVSAIAMVVRAVPNNQRGRALGINIGAVYIGLSISPVIGGSLTYNFGWESIFIITLPVILLIILGLRFKVPGEWTLGENDPIDFKGSILYVIGIICFMYGFTILNELEGVILAIIGIIFFLIFGFYELHVDYPIFEVRLLRNSKFLSSNLASIISYIAIFAIATILNYHFQYIRGWDAQLTGLILVVTPLMQAIVTPQSGKLSDRMNPQKLAACGMGLVTLSLFLLIFLTKTTPLWIVIVAMILQGVGFGIFSSPNTNTIMSSVPEEDTSMASAAVSTMRVIGQTLSMGMLTVLFAFVMGSVVIKPSVYGELALSCHYALIISTILGLISVLISLVGVNSNGKLNTDNIR